MENASKALIIAGGVLIAVLILTLGVYLFSNASSFSESYAERVTQDKLNEFNNKFIIYAKDLTPQEMVSIINLITENNKKNIEVSENQIELVIDNVIINVMNVTQEWKNDLMEQSSIDEGNAIKYKFMSVLFNTDSGRVKKLIYVST